MSEDHARADKFDVRRAILNCKSLLYQELDTQSKPQSYENERVTQYFGCFRLYTRC